MSVDGYGIFADKTGVYCRACGAFLCADMPKWPGILCECGLSGMGSATHEAEKAGKVFFERNPNFLHSSLLVRFATALADRVRSGTVQ